MAGCRMIGARPFALLLSWCCFLGWIAQAKGQAAEPPEKVDMQRHHHAHQMNIPSGASERCEAKFAYQSGTLGPEHWGQVCSSGQMQSPVDITRAKTMPVPPLAPLEFHYQPAELDLVNDCNHYLVKVRFPDNLWLKVARKPYRLSEIDFHEPGENAIKGKRPAMSLQFVHLSPEATFLIVEVPVVEGKENPLIGTLWKHIPASGKEQVTSSIKINAMDLLPADRGFYTFRGSLTNPICNEGVAWFVLKHPIEMSASQIAQYRQYYHDTARPLQPLRQRPVLESP
jgi:carbonic anhydrase